MTKSREDIKGYIRDLNLSLVVGDHKVETDITKRKDKYQFLKKNWKVIKHVTKSGGVLCGSRSMRCYSIGGKQLLDRHSNDWDFIITKDMAFKICEHFGKAAVKVDGSMSKPERQHSVDSFQDSDKIKVFVGNIKAAGVGITLTAAEAVIMNDLSFLPQGVGAIGAAIIGPTEKGPAFVPTVVRSFAEYERRFGGLSSETFIPQTVREYLKNAGSVTVTRVLAGGGYTYATATNPFVAVAVSASSAPSASSNRNVLLGVIFPSKATSKPGLESSTMVGPSGSFGRVDESFSLTLAGTNVTSTQLSASLNPASKEYLFKQLGDNPNNSKKSSTTYGGTDTLPGYTYNNWKTFTSNMLGASTKEVSTITFATTMATQSMVLASCGPIETG